MAKVDKKGLTGPASNVEVVVLAAFLLGADRNPVDTEDIAMKAHELAPGRFTWRKYPDQVNLEWVRVRLSEAKGNEYEWLDGKGQEGWTLTPEGCIWARKAAQTYLSRDLTSHRPTQGLGAVDEKRARREKNRLLGTRAWVLWQKKQGLTEQEAREVFRIDDYAVGRMKHMKITRLTSLFEGDQEMQRFLLEMAKIITPRGPEDGTN